MVKLLRMGGKTWFETVLDLFIVPFYSDGRVNIVKKAQLVLCVRSLRDFLIPFI
jgi:hypothetical protein